LHVPAGELAERFGIGHKMGVGYTFKSKKNWLISAEAGSLFGAPVKENPLDSIASSTGFIINGEGFMEIIQLQQRGFSASVQAGILIPAEKINPNSGFVAMIGAGFIQHRIHFNYSGGYVFQLDGEYLKGYDRLTNGATLNQTIGFLHLDNKNRVNFLLGLDLVQGFTQNRRSWNFDTMERDDRKRLDLQFGLRISWVFPVFDRNPSKIYTY
jgi:hypothetical protein